MKIAITINTTIPSIQKRDGGWFIFVENRPEIQPAGPYGSMATAMGAMDLFCSSRNLDNSVIMPECPKCGNLYDHRYPCVS